MTFSSEAIHEEVRCLIHLPPCYDHYTEQAFPVLYLLHGWPMDERHWDAIGFDELMDDWHSRGLIGPFIVVMPGVSPDGLYVNSSGGPGSFEGMLVQELLPRIDATYRTWREPAGRGIGGISRGGVWALEIALRNLELFGILGAHSPALALNRPLPQYDPFLLVEEKQDSLTDIRVYLDAGDKDWSKGATIRFRDLLLEHGVNVIYQEHQGGHVDELWQDGLADYLIFYTQTWPGTFEALPDWESGPDLFWLDVP